MNRLLILAVLAVLLSDCKPKENNESGVDDACPQELKGTKFLAAFKERYEGCDEIRDGELVLEYKNNACVQKNRVVDMEKHTRTEKVVVKCGDYNVYEYIADD